MAAKHTETVADEWVNFPGGELAGKRPKALCPACRDALRRVTHGAGGARPRPRTLCFQCYRADLERTRALKAAGTLDTSSAARFQFQLPFQPVNGARLGALKAARVDSRAARPPHADRRRHAQIEARHALAQIAVGLKARGLSAPGNPDGSGAIFQAVHAAELQLPDSWIPFVVSR